MYYLSSIPKNITPDIKCIIMLHGVGSNERDLFGLHEQFGEDIMVSSLQGPFTLGVERYAWYRVDFSTGKPIYKIEDVERGYEEILSCIDKVSGEYGIKSEHIFLLGFSQGAIMSYYTLRKSPEKLGGIIALSGRILDEISTTDINTERYEGKRVFIGHGELDNVISFSASEHTRSFVQSLDLTPDFHAYPIAHTISHREIQDIVSFIR